MDKQPERDPFGMDAIRKYESVAYGVGHVADSLAASASGKYLACTDMLGRLHVFDSRAGKRLVFLKPGKDDKGFADVVFHPKEHLLAFFHGTNRMEIREAETGKVVRNLNGASSNFVRNRGQALLISGDHQHDDRIKLWNWTSDKSICTVLLNRDLDDGVLSHCEVAFTSDAMVFVAGNSFGP